MTTTTRTDVHRLAVLDPADYTAIAEVDEREDGRSYDIEDGGLEYAEAHTIQPTRGCALCGQARAATWVAFRHDPTGDVIWTGWICAEKVGLGSRDDLDARRSGDTINWAKARGHRLAGDPAARRAIDYCARKVVEFIEEGDKVKVTMRFRGRELSHGQLGMAVLQRAGARVKALEKRLLDAAAGVTAELAA